MAFVAIGVYAYTVGILTELISELQRPRFKKDPNTKRKPDGSGLFYSRSQQTLITVLIPCGVLDLRWQLEDEPGDYSTSPFSSMISQLVESQSLVSIAPGEYACSFPFHLSPHPLVDLLTSQLLV